MMKLHFVDFEEINSFHQLDNVEESASQSDDVLIEVALFFF